MPETDDRKTTWETVRELRDSVDKLQDEVTYLLEIAQSTREEIRFFFNRGQRPEPTSTVMLLDEDMRTK